MHPARTVPEVGEDVDDLRGLGEPPELHEGPDQLDVDPEPTPRLEDTAGVLGSGPEVPNWLEQIANKPADELEIDGGENVMLGHTGKKLGTVQDVLFDDDQLVGIVLKPAGWFKSEVILPRRFLDRSDDLALFANIDERDVENLKPFQAED